jgi:HME family heavy-metal exporter
LKGEVTTKIRHDEKEIEVVVKLPEEDRKNIDAIKRTLIQTPDGALIQVKEIADIYYEKGPNRISHQNNERNLTISCNVNDRDIGGAVDEIKKAIADQVDFKTGYYVAYEGQFVNREKATNLILWLSLLSFAIIVVLLYNKFKSLAIVGQILISIPFALIGGLIAIMLTGGDMSIASMIGFIALCGIASRNGLMLITRYVDMMEQDKMEFNHELLVKGSIDRLVPVLMTAVTAILAMLPLLFESDAPGKEMLYPVAVVITGGLITSTFLEIIITPVLFKIIGQKAVDRYIKAKEKGPLIP